MSAAQTALRIAGYAALFDVRDAGRDVIRPGAFFRTLRERRLDLSGTGRDPLPLYWQHRPDQRVGWVQAASEDARGLRVTASIDNPEGGAAAAVLRGAVSGLSFGYRVRAATRDAAGRELLDVDLIEVSLVTHPMQHAARIHLVQ